MGVPRRVRKPRQRSNPLGSGGETAEKPGMQSSTAETRAGRIRQAIEAALTVTGIEVQDESRLHAGHAGAAPGGETHYSVTVVSPDFAGMARLARSRAVHAVLAGEFAGGLHALSLRLLTPDEAARGA
jgi:stress-induced morphogen